MLTRRRARTLVDNSTKTMYIQREIREETNLCDETHISETKTSKSDEKVPIKIEINQENDQLDKDGGGNSNLSLNQVRSDTVHQNMDKSNTRSTDVLSVDSESFDLRLVKQEIVDEDSRSSDGDPEQQNIPMEHNLIKEEHEQISQGEKPFVCKLCKASFPEFQSLFRHLESHRNFSAISLLRNMPEPKNVKKPVSQSITDIVSRSQPRKIPPSNASRVENSLQQASTSETACDTSLVIKCETDSHNQGLHPPVRAGDDTVCDESVFPSGFSSQLAQIVDKLHKRAYHCMQTDQTLSASNFENCPGIHAKRIFICDICKRCFGRKYHYKRHMMIKHTKSPTFQCSQCDKRFKRRSHFDRHRCIRPQRCQMWKTHGW